MTNDPRAITLDEGPQASPLVSAHWLNQHLDSENLVILDATWTLPAQNRNPKTEFKTAHIPGALTFDIDRIANTASPLPHMLPSISLFEAEAGKLGIDTKTWVIVYDSNLFMASARAWWMFRIFGHERVRVLDGGLAAWKALDLNLDGGEAHQPTAKIFRAHFRPELLANLEQILMSLGSPRQQLIDARPIGRFKGIEPEPRPGLRSGRIPGSRHLFFKDLIDAETGCFKPTSDIKQAFEVAGMALDRPITSTCGSGVTAAILCLGLFCIGHRSASVYDGSFAEWGLDIGTPIEVDTQVPNRPDSQQKRESGL
jgi:thiosulfate/3-mercaptopyruvate sulfurtransferase